jgi:hypothetical protein
MIIRSTVHDIYPIEQIKAHLKDTEQAFTISILKRRTS